MIAWLTLPPVIEMSVTHAFDVSAVTSENGGPTAPPPGNWSCTGPLLADPSIVPLEPAV